MLRGSHMLDTSSNMKKPPAPKMVVGRSDPRMIILRNIPPKAFSLKLDRKSATDLEKLKWASQMSRRDVLLKILKAFFELSVEQQLQIMERED